MGGIETPVLNGRLEWADAGGSAWVGRVLGRPRFLVEFDPAVRLWRLTDLHDMACVCVGTLAEARGAAAMETTIEEFAGPDHRTETGTPYDFVPAADRP